MPEQVDLSKFEKKRGNELGKKSNTLYYLDTCPDCKKQVWHTKYHLGERCQVCGHIAQRKVKLPCIHDKTGRILYKDNCPVCGKELWHVKSHLGRKCKDCANKAARKSTLPTKRNNNGRLLYKDHCRACGKIVWRCSSRIGQLCRNCVSRETVSIRKTRRFTEHPNWKGGRYVLVTGYILLVLQPDHPYYSMCVKRSHAVLEHRLVMAQHLGRPLEDWEIVHHKNHIRSDNRIENLELLPNDASNTAYTVLRQKIISLELEIEMLKANMNIENKVVNREGNG